MKRIYFSVALDSILCAFIYLLLSYVFFNYFFERNVTLTLSLTTMALLTLFSVRLLFKKRRLVNFNAELDKQKNKLMTQLHFMPKSRLSALFIKAFNSLGFSTEKRKDGIYLPDKKTLVILKFGYQEVTKADVVKAFNLIKKDQSVEIYSEEFSTEVKQFAERFVNVKLKDGEKVLDLLKKSDCLSEIDYVVPEENRQRTSALKSVFNKRRAKTFFGFGIFFLFSSLFVPLKTYYIVSGSVMLIIALICIFFGSRKKAPD